MIGFMAHGERPLLVLCVLVLAAIVGPIVAVYVRPSRHDRSIHRARSRHWE